MEFSETHIHGIYVVNHDVKGDPRGSFFRSYCKEEFARIGFFGEMVQSNQSFTSVAGSIRGLHFQKGEYAEDKLIRCLHGEVLDVAVDLRTNSPTFLQHFSIELRADRHQSILIPKGCAHGFQTLTDNATLLYQHSQYYAPDHEGGLRYDDPKIGITWPLEPADISNRDRNHPYLTDDFQGIYK